MEEEDDGAGGGGGGGGGDEDDKGGGGDEDDKGGGGAPAWPEDWRNRVSGDDAAMSKYLGRYASPEAALKGGYLANQSIDKRGLRLPENPTEEDLKAYNKSIGVPEDPSKYEIKLTGERKLDDSNKEMVDLWLAGAHKAGLTSAQASAMLDTYFDVFKQAQEMSASDQANARAETTTALKEEWGVDYNRNMASIKNMVSMYGGGNEDLQNFVLDFVNEDKDFAQFLIGLTLAANPAATVVPAGQDQDKAIESELNDIREVMRKDRARYNKDEKMQARFRELIAAQERMQGQRATG